MESLTLAVKKAAECEALIHVCSSTFKDDRKNVDCSYQLWTWEWEETDCVRSFD